MPTAATLVQPELVSVDEFYGQYEGREGRHELVRGRVVSRVSPANLTHAAVDSEFHDRLKQYCRTSGKARVYPNAGFILRREPDCVRGPDLAVVTAEHQAVAPRPESGFWETAPDLVVEIISPGDSADEITDKIQDYLEAGTRAVWAVYPRRRLVQVHRQDGTSVLVSENGVLTGGELLPGLTIEMSRLWRDAEA